MDHYQKALGNDYHYEQDAHTATAFVGTKPDHRVPQRSQRVHPNVELERLNSGFIQP
jgi:hypothetical protein